MKLADYVIQFLREHEIRQVFTVYGSAIGDLVDAFNRVEDIEYICPIHEQAGAFMAEVQAKLTYWPSACLVTSGPGAINLMTGIANCYYDSVPVIFITGQVNTRFLKPNNDIRQVGFQENDTVSMAKPITKYATMIKKPWHIRWELEKAFDIATRDRPGPVLIDIPQDIQKAELADIDKLEKYEPLIFPTNHKDRTEEVAHDLLEAERPVMLVGGGVLWSGADSLVRELGSKLQIPCFPTWNAIDVITSDYEYYAGRVGTYGGPGRNFAIQNSDFLLSIGSRISGRITGGQVDTFARAAKKYIVDIDKYNTADGEHICQDASLFIQSLMKKLPDKMPDWSWWLEQSLKWKQQYQHIPEYDGEGVNPYHFMKALSNELDKDDVVVVDCGGNVVVTYQALETKWGQRVISSHGNSPMGFSFAGAIGAALMPEVNRVVCIIGDGGMQMNIQELQTVAKYGLDKLKVFILNNHCYGITRQYQETNFEGRHLACGPDGYDVPNFLEIARAYELDSLKSLKSEVDMTTYIQAALTCPSAIIVDVDCGMFAQYEPRIFGWKTPIEDMYPYLSREEFRHNMIIEPIEGWENPEMPKTVEANV